MTVDLYYTPLSSPCRAVLLTAEAIGLSLNLKEIDLFSGEHLKPEYEQLNPQKTVPFLLDGDYRLTESRAIMSYLADQYGKNVRLNPQTPIGRALVNQRLHFDIGTLYRGMKDYYYPVVFGNATEYNEERYKSLQGAFEVLDKFLDGQDYAAGRNLTIADLALVATVSTSEMFGFEVENYANVAKWMDRIKSCAPGYRKANVECLQMLKKFVEDKNKE
ncbi:PREDICTED: glutathione S-transferase 1-1-like [Habropoda laboriosa]|uniref:glutathione S-transferase 1-1-like n=1 Tax=Habropoda laboriosa TaxID=597456 RepID=UPI00083E05EE|nr:PREDICTED: glutathione S-transferase 1-1-like [Habropoda laboriosa]